MDETVLLVVITEQGENRNQCEEQWNLFGFSHVPASPRPDPEVVADAKRRTFTAAYKQRILARRGSSILRHPAWEFTDLLPLSFGWVEPAC